MMVTHTVDIDCNSIAVGFTICPINKWEDDLFIVLWAAMLRTIPACTPTVVDSISAGLSYIPNQSGCILNHLESESCN